MFSCVKYNWKMDYPENEIIKKNIWNIIKKDIRGNFGELTVKSLHVFVKWVINQLRHPPWINYCN